MTDLFVGLGMAALTALIVYLIFLAISWIIAVIRVATNKRMAGGSKALWILVSIFIPGGASLYFVFKDNSKFLKFMGWVTLVPTLMAIGYFTAASFDPNPLPSTPVASAPQVPAPVPPPMENNAGDNSGNEGATLDQGGGVPEVPSSSPEIPAQNPVTPPDPLAPAQESSLDEAKRLSNDFMTAKDQKSKNETYEKAFSAYNKLIAAEPDNIEALLGRAELNDMWVPQSGRRDYETVRNKLTPLLEQAPGDVALLRQRAKAYKGMREMDLAKADMQAAIDADPSNPGLKAEMQRLVDDKPFGL
ncbi:MAG: hypothetical protein DI586_08210 [Micavibrio aeruginosavorus]|uniref:Cardiolipin synthase N-terminal domain-containing protein n=1 Tax=Micavibrio aeruginosavorus TaxID=349221 RepID=A0A2W5FME4_9BACT|nr:MAG: hypothetical protein DI586_08210 [Micavibrio aeruginosavorus]